MLILPICHIVLMPSDLDSERFSTFQGFSPELIDKDYQKIFSLIQSMPYEVNDIFLEPEEFVRRRRSCSSCYVQLINENLLNSNFIDTDQCFQILWCAGEKSLSKANAAISKFRYEPIIISSKKVPNATHFDELTQESFSQLIMDKINNVLSIGVSEEILQILEALRELEPVSRSKGDLSNTDINHWAIEPNSNLLMCYGYSIDNSKVKIPKDIKRSVISTTEHIDQIASETYEVINGKNDALVYTTSMYAHLYTANNPFWRKINRDLDNSFQRNLINKILIRNDGYSRATTEVEIDDYKKDMEKAWDNEVFRGLIGVRQAELSLFTKIVSIKAASQFIPAVRLPNSVNLHHDILRTIAYLISRGDQKSKHKLKQKFRQYRDAISKEIGSDLLELSFKRREKLLTICDFPIEWLSANRILPIMFTHEVSRVPAVPGNLFLQSVLGTQEVFIPYSALTKILILRSFKDDDPIKDHLFDAIDHLKKTDGSINNLDITCLDVATEDDLCSALREFDGGIVIFDCHGGHGGIDEPGWLSISEQRIDIWKLKGKVRVPPICLLSACSTQPVDGSHASVANGLFNLGAHSILGTFAPIGAADAAIFISRVLLRISSFIPILIEIRPVSWRTIISGMFRMSYITDVTRGLLKDGLIDSDAYTKICERANFYINEFRSDWFEKYTSDVLESSQMKQDEFHKLLETNYQFVETMLYSHLGQPEDLVIMKDQD